MLELEKHFKANEYQVLIYLFNMVGSKVMANADEEEFRVYQGVT